MRSRPFYVRNPKVASYGTAARKLPCACTERVRLIPRELKTNWNRPEKFDSTTKNVSSSSFIIESRALVNRNAHVFVQADTMNVSMRTPVQALSNNARAVQH